MSDPIDDRDPELDELTRAQLGEYDDRAAKVADVLDEWLLRAHGVTSSAHNVGLFLDLLAAEGYRVEPIEAPTFAEVMPDVNDDGPDYRDPWTLTPDDMEIRRDMEGGESRV